MTPKKFHRINEFANNVEEYRTKGFEKGFSCGFKTGDNLMSYKLGYWTFIYSYPGSGKTTFVFDQLIYLAKRYGLQALIFSPETGTKEEITATLMQPLLGKKLFGIDRQAITSEEWDEAINFLDKHFIIYSVEDYKLKDSKVTIEDIYKDIPALNAEHGFDIKLVLIDPLTHIDPSSDAERLQIQFQVREVMKVIKAGSKKLNLHTFAVTHLRDVDKMLHDKELNVDFYPPPQPHGLMGGQENWRSAYQMVAIWQPPAGLMMRDGVTAYRENQMAVIVQKSKPVGVGSKGQFVLTFDWRSYKYQEEMHGDLYYAGEYESTGGAPPFKLDEFPLKPLPKYDPDEEAPF